MRPKLLLLFAVLLLLPASGLRAEVRLRPAAWAQPVIGAGLTNFHKLDDHLYRSEQPEEKSFRALKEFGIKTVLNLRDNHSDDDDARGMGFTLLRLELEADEISTDELVTALRFIRQAEKPVLVHCWHGSDRTGAVAAAYRLVFQNWSKEEAVDELIHGGYGFHAMYDNIPRLLRGLDVEALRDAVNRP